METVYLCAQCARRLGRYTAPEIPELFEGYCPQCGGTEALVTAEFSAPAESAPIQHQRQQEQAA